MDKDKMLEKIVTLLDIKSKFCDNWMKIMNNYKTMNKEEKNIFESVTGCAILSNTDNDEIPVIHIRFDFNIINYNTVINFMEIIINKFKIKGMMI